MSATPYTGFTSLDEVRNEIDRLDQELVRLLARRAQCVRAAAAFKTSESSVRAPERVRRMLEARREWAGAEGIDPAFVVDLFRRVTSHFIDRELREWRLSAAEADGVSGRAGEP